MSRSGGARLARERKRLEEDRRSDSVTEHVARCLHRLREERGLGEAELAAKIGLSHAVLQSYETGLRPIGAGTLFELATALETPIAAFFDGLPAAARSGESDELAASDDDLIDLLLRIKDPVLLMRLTAFVRYLARNPKPR